MKIKTIVCQHRRDFEAIFECEHCGELQRCSGYDDANYHQNVLPTFECPKCGKVAASNYRPLVPKYEEGFQI